MGGRKVGEQQPPAVLEMTRIVKKCTPAQIYKGKKSI